MALLVPTGSTLLSAVGRILAWGTVPAKCPARARRLSRTIDAGGCRYSDFSRTSLGAAALTVPYADVTQSVSIALIAVALTAGVGVVVVLALVRLFHRRAEQRAARLEKTIDEATAALAASQQRFQLAVRGTDVGIWDWDLRSGKVYFSPRWKSMLGYGDDEISDEALEWDSRIHPEDRRQATETLQAFLLGETPTYELEHRLRHKDGSYRWILARGLAVRDLQGRPTRMVGSHLDITEWKESAERLRELAEALRRSNRELEQFAYVVSHDLQEPLRMISAYLGTLVQEHGKEFSPRVHTLLDLSLQTGLRMRELIDNLLAYCRAGGDEQYFEAVSCDEALDNALRNLKLVIDETRAEVTRAELPVVWADRTQVVRLFQNLMSNAIKFHGNTPPMVEVRAEKDGDFWEFSVRDNGIGIPAEYAERVFKVFERLHTGDEYPGTGIGLAMCKRIVDRYGGHIWFTSEAGQGTTFHFTLPGGDAEKLAPEGVSSAVSGTDTRKGDQSL